MGFQHLNKTAQNLRDKLVHVEKTTKATLRRITDEIRRQQQESQDKTRSHFTSGFSSDAVIVWFRHRPKFDAVVQEASTKKTQWKTRKPKSSGISPG